MRVNLSNTGSVAARKRELLEAGDIKGLLELNRMWFGDARMEATSEDDKDEDSGDDDADEDSDDEDDEGDDEDGQGDKSDPKDLEISNLKDENKRRRIRARNQRNEILELKRQLAAKGKEKTEGDDSGEKPVDDSRVRELEKTNEDLLIRLEFMGSSKFRWKNPRQALKLLDLSNVTIGDGGEIDGLDDAIEELAESDPYLLEETKSDSSSSSETKTGRKTGSGKKGSPNTEALLRKYPALRR